MDRIEVRLKDPWFSESGLFDTVAIDRLARLVRGDASNGARYGFRPYAMCLWLCSMREFARRC